MAADFFFRAMLDDSDGEIIPLGRIHRNRLVWVKSSLFVLSGAAIAEALIVLILVLSISANDAVFVDDFSFSLVFMMQCVNL